jgi:hypothetical protein
MACQLFNCGIPDLAAAQTLIAINDVPFVGQPPYSFDFGVLDCCQPQTVKFTFRNDLQIVGNNIPISIDGSNVQQCWPVGFPGIPCIDNNFNGQIQVSNYTSGNIPYGGSYDIYVTISPNCVDCGAGTTQLVFYIASADQSLGKDTCCQVVIDLDYDIKNNIMSVIPNPIVLQTDICNCVNSDVLITNDSCVSRNYTVSLINCSGYFTIIGPTNFALAPQASQMVTVRYCPGVLQNGSCFLRIVDSCQVLTDIPISYSAVNCPRPTFCNDCTDAVKLNGVPVESTPCKTACGNIGDTLDITVNACAPVRAFAVSLVDQLNNIFYITGDWTMGFVNGASFIISGSTCNDGAYTVVTSMFDGTYTQITVTGPIPCSTPDGTLTIIQNSCPPSIVLTVTNLDTGQVILSNAYPVNPGDCVYDVQQIIMSTYGTHEIKIEACDCFGCDNCVFLIDACTQYKITKNKCNEYTFTDNDTTTPKILTIVVANLDGTYSQTYTMDTSITNTLIITLPGDGVYTVTITNNLTDDIVVLPLVELCQLNNCIKKLILEIMCNEKDPCCKECNEQEIERLRQLRYEMNKIIALYFTLQALLKKHEIDFTGVFTMDECHSQALSEINDIFVKLNAITLRCGECKQSTEVQAKPCTTC